MRNTPKKWRASNEPLPIIFQAIDDYEILFSFYNDGINTIFKKATTDIQNRKALSPAWGIL